jgi:hypothetical protein
VRRLFTLFAFLFITPAIAFAQIQLWTISSGSPTTAAVGQGDTSITLSGAFPIPATVNWNNAPTEVTLSVTASAPNSITAVIPQSLLSAAGTAQIFVTDASGNFSNSISFNIVNPTISSISPTEVGVGSTDLTINVIGTGFVSGVTTLFCKSGNCPSGGVALSTTVGTSTQLTAVLPAMYMASFGSGNLFPTNTGSISGLTSNVQLAIKQPQISNISPTTTPAAVDTIVTVNGTDFVSGSQIAVCLSSCGNQSNYSSLTTTFVGSTQLTATIPAATLSSAFPGNLQIEVVNVPASPSGTTSNQAGLTVTAPIPSVTMLSPASTPALSTSFTLTVTGTNFINSGGHSTVLWCNSCGGSNTSLATTFVNATTLTATVPANLITGLGSATILVTNGGSAVSTLNQTFAITVPTPAVTSISPTGAIAGSGNTTLTVNGSNFLNGVSTVTWCLSGCGSPTNLTTTYVSPTQLTAQIPSALLTTAGTAAVGVTNSSGGTIVNSGSTLGFAITAATTPTVSAISPSSATAGTPNNVTVTLTGTNYVSGANGSVATWCNFCSGNPTNLGTTFVSATSLTAVIPSSLLTAAGSAQIGVTNNGSNSSAVNQTFTINPKPVLSNLSTTSAVAGQGAIATLTLTGTGFPTSNTIVNWVGPTATTTLTIGSNTATSITVSVPAALLTTAGNATISVTDSVNQVASNTLTLTIAAPSVTSVSPAAITSGTANNITLTVNGQNYLSGNVSVVTWCNSCGGSPTQLATTYVSATQLTAVIPSSLLAVAGSAQVGVSNGTGTGPTTATFTIAAKPVLSTLTPSTATAGQGAFSLTLSGTGFPTTSPIVNWTAASVTTPLTITASSSTSITATVPGSLLTSAGTASLTVSDSLSGVSSNAVNLTISASGVTSISPTKTPAGTTTPVTLTVNGSNFVSGSSTVTFCNSCAGNPVQLNTTFVNAGQLQATIPVNLLTTAGSAQIGVTTGSVPAPGTQTFTITGAPVLSTLSPTSASAGQAGFNLTLTGSNFPTASTIVNWSLNGQTTSLAITANSATSITATVPASVLATAGSATVTVTDSVSQVVSNGVTFAVNGPTVTTISPTGAVAGTSSSVTVTVTGSNFVNGSIVTWCNSCGTSPVTLTTTYIGGSQLTAVIPTNLLTTSASVQIGVINSPSSLPTSTQTFTVGPGPSLTSLSTNSAVAGQASFNLILSGTNFPTPSPVVNWKVGTTNTTLAVTASTATSITATVTAALLANAGNATVTVTDAASGVTSNGLPFTITGPVLTSISPAAATAGTASPITITITGSNFVNGSIATWCNSCGSSPVQLTTSYVSGSQIMATIPASLLTTSGTAQVGVINSSSGSPTSTQNFVINPKPTLTSLSQQFAIVNAANPINLTLTGSNFPTVSPLVNWTFSGQTTSLAITASSASSITATVPTSLLTTAGTATVSVSDSVSMVSSNTQPFVIASGPQISANGLNPSSIAVGSPTFSLMITGADFAAGNVLIWTPSGGTPITIPSSALTVGSGGTSITATINASLVSTVGTVSIAVQDAVDNVTSNLETFTVGGPTLTSISPTGTTIGVTNSTTLTVNGTNFVNGVSTVTWCNSCGSNPTPLTTTFVSSSQLTAVIPASLITGQGSVQIGVQNGNVPSTGTQFFTIGAVGLTMIAPSTASAGSPGFSITITGSNFTSAASVVFTLGTTVQSLTTTFISATQLQAFVPTSLLTTAGTANVSVQVGTSVSNAATFSIVGPTISTLTPNQSATGVGSFPITVAGSNFLSGSIVQWTFGGTTTPLSTSFQDASTLVAVVNSAQVTTAGTALVSVLNTGGAVSPSVIFTVGAAPSINTNSSGITPATATAGSGTTAITITGTNFQTGSIVTWNNAGTITNLATGFNSATQLTATVPAALLATSGSALVTVQNPGPVNSNSVTFTIAPGVTPSITPPLVPSSAAAGGAPFQLTVMGSNFVNGSIIQWNNGTTTTALTTSFSASQLSALVPANLIATAGTAFVSVLNPGGGTSATVSFTISSNQPTISSTNGLAPATAQVGSAALQVTVTGTGFVSGSTVMWNAGSSAQSVPTVFVSSTSLTAIVPATDFAAAGTVLVSVSNPGGAVSNTALFSVTPAAAPSINTTGGLDPSSAVTGSASFLLSVTGSNFFSGSTVQWSVGSTPTILSTSFISSTQLSAVVPASLLAAAGSAFITVINPGGVSSNTVVFTVGSAPGPVLNTLTPASATAGGPAYQMLVSGMNFATGSVVQWNSGSGATSLATIVLSSTQLSALVPANLTATAGTAFVDVMNTGGATSNLQSYPISAGTAPSINSTGGLTPAMATVGSASIQLSVLGSNFTSSSVVQWSTGSTPTALSTVVVSPTALSAIIPTSLLSAAGTAFVSVTNGSGNVSNSVPFTVGVQGAPTISTANGLLPNTAAAGGPAMQLVVVGTNFVSGSVVYWNNGTNQALTTSYVGPSQITAVIPASLLATQGVVFVSVQNPGPVNSNSVQFTIGASTSLATISSSNGVQPSTIAAGSAAFQIVVTGSNFQNGSVVQWNANGTAQALTTGFGSSTTLNALVPATLVATPGIAFISVMNPDKSVSNSITFTVAGSLPVVTQLTPTSAAAGTAGLQLTVAGTGFSSSSVVQWNGTAIPTNFGSATQLTATVSATLLQTVGMSFITVVNPGGSITSGATFTVAGPTLTTISPTSATAGAASLALTLTGTNFVTGSVASWNGSALPTTVTNATSATAQVSAAQLATAGTFVVVVTNPGGAVSGTQFFVLSAPSAPTVTGATPASAVAGSAAFQITLAGTGFVAGSVIQWNGAAVATTYVSPTQLTAIISATLIASAGTANITVQIPGAPLSATTLFPVNPPSITTLSPTTVSAGGPAFTLTVTGGNFIPGSTVQWNGTSLPTIYNSATQLTADVAASLIASGGSASVTVQNGGTATSAASTFSIGPFTLVISTTTLPDAIVGSGYSQILAATGGSPPYTWSVTAGTLPSGIAIDPGSGTVSGTATAAVTGTVGFTVTDSVARTVTKSIAFRSVAPLTVTTTTPLNSAPAGVSFSQILAATGGTAPYTWTLTGSLPTGLSLNSTTGQISGTPTVPGAYNFTINITDSRSQATSVPFTQTVTVAGVTIGGITTTSTSGQQLPINVTIANPYSVNLNGTLTLVFTSAVGASDPAIQFSSGGLTANFTIPAGTTQAVFGTQQSVLLITGTTAGSIAVTAGLQAAGASVTPSTAPAITTTIAKTAPVITGVTFTTSGTSLVVSVTGYSNTRDMTSGNFQFIAAAGSTLTAAPVVVNLAATFSTWYQSSASLNFGTQFTFSVPISFTGNINAIGSVSVTLVNSAGTSAAVTATRQ